MKRIRRRLDRLKELDKNVFALYDVVLFVSQLGSVCVLKSNENKNELVFSSRAAFVVVSVLLITLIHFFLTPYGISRIENLGSEETSSNLVNSVTKMLNPLLVSFVAIVFRVASFFNVRKHLPALIKSLHDADTFLKYGRPRHGEDLKKIFWFVLVLFSISFPFQFYSVYSNRNTTGAYNILFGINMYNNFTAACTDFQFVAICFLLYARFSCVNGKLKSWARYLFEIRDAETEGKVFSIYTKTNAGNENKISNEIFALQKAHRCLFEASQSLNEAYNVQLFLSLFTGGINVLLNVYFALYGGFQKSLDGLPKDARLQQNFEHILNEILWSLYYFVRFVLVCSAANFACREGNYSRVLVTNLFSSYWNRSVKEEIWNFSAYVFTKKISFDACGFFPIKLSLITTLISTSCTYLVLLAQIHNHR